MAKPKLRGSWGGKIEAQAGLGVAKPKLRRASGSISGRSGVTLGGLRAGLGGSGGVRGGQGRARGKFSKNRCFENRCTVCSLKRRIRWSGSRPKINFDKISVSGPAGPAGTARSGSYGW